MICIPIVAPTSNGALKDIKDASRIADVIELRLDFIKDINKKTLKKLLSTRLKKVIVTDRKTRKYLIEEAIKLKTDFIDLDISIGEKTIKEIIKKQNKTKTIISFHNFKKTDKKEIIKKYNQIKKLNPDIIKIATFANSINDNLVIFNLIKKAKKERPIHRSKGFYLRVRC